MMTQKYEGKPTKKLKNHQVHHRWFSGVFAHDRSLEIAQSNSKKNFTMYRIHSIRSKISSNLIILDKIISDVIQLNLSVRSKSSHCFNINLNTFNLSTDMNELINMSIYHVVYTELRMYINLNGNLR